MVIVTDNAKNELEKIVSGKNIRIFDLIFNGFGWGGPNIGLVESDKNDIEGSVNCNGFYFHIDNRLKEIQSQLGKIVIDFVDGFWGKKFLIQFEGMSSC